jgi:hypothetical protein
MTTGEFEWPSYNRGIREFNERLRSRSYIRGGYRFRVVENMRHAGEKAESYTQGLRYVAEPWAETGPAAEQFSDPVLGTYEVAFRPEPGFVDKSAWTHAQSELLREHERLIDRRSMRDGTGSALHSLQGDPDAYSSLFMFANGRREAESFAASDPAVAAGILAFEVICVREPKDLAK